jgi:uncharacterized repeat protein (TIGR01451 family)
VFALIAPGSAAATTITVQNTNDSGGGSLRQAIADANPGDVILVPAGTYVLTTGELSIGKDLSIQGADAASTTVSGNDASRVFEVTSGNVTLSGLTIAHGKVTGAIADGAGILNAGTLSIVNSVIANNFNAASAIGEGGGIRSTGTLTVTGSSIVDNTLGTPTTAISQGGAIDAAGPLTVSNSDLSRNTAISLAISQGGGLNIFNVTAKVTGTTLSGNSVVARNGATIAEGGGIALIDGTLQLTNSTISANQANSDIISQGGGLAMFGGGATILNVTMQGNQSNSTLDAEGGNVDSGTGSGGSGVSFKNTIVSGGVVSGGTTTGPNCTSSGPNAITSQGHNLENADTCGFTAPGDLRNTDPQLGPLQNNGGPTSTHALPVTSPAVDAADNNGCPSTDQRGIPRPQNEVCDIGAFEFVFQADLGVTKAGSPARVAAGRNVTYTITVTNSGPQAALGVTLKDALPASLALVSASPQGACSGAPLTCALNDLAPGQSETVTIVARTRSAGPVVNTAEVSGSRVDPNPANNRASTMTTVVAGRARIAVAGLSRRCQSRAFTARVDVTTPGATVRSVRVKLDNRTLATRRSRKFAVRVPVAGLRAGQHRLTIEASTSAGTVRRRILFFTGCAASRRPPRFTG